MSFEIKITKDYDGIKPKSFLKKKLDLSFFKIPRLIKDKRITINGKKIKEDTILKDGDILKVWPNDIKLREVKKEFREKKDLGLEIIYENNDFIIFNKLSGVIVQGAQDNSKSLSLHLAYYKDKIDDKSDFEYFHVHRLDKDTSGALVVAKNRVALRELNKIFRTREIKKKYLALVVGKPKEKEGMIEVFMKRNPEGSREKMSIVSENDSLSKKSISLYKVISEYEKEGNIFSLIEVEIKTGITHQIRVHMKSLGCPIVGDKMYGNSYINQEYNEVLDRQFLHAKSISFTFDNNLYNFEADLTEDLKNFLEYISD